MLTSKSYNAFKNEDLPDLPPKTDGCLVNLFRPEAEPKFDAHFSEARAFRDWLSLPNINPQRYPNSALNNNTTLGTWIFLCASEWRERYVGIEDQNKTYGTAMNHVGSGAIVAILGVIGLDVASDGEIEAEDIDTGDAGWTIGGIAAKVGLPLPFSRRQQNARRLREVMEIIKAHYVR